MLTQCLLISWFSDVGFFIFLKHEVTADVEEISEAELLTHTILFAVYPQGPGSTEHPLVGKERG